QFSVVLRPEPPIMPLVSFAPPSLCLTFLPRLFRLLPSLPPPVRDLEVPPVFRRPFIPSGYRPPGLPLRCYVLSLFQIHNETLNVWSHLLAAVCVALRLAVFTGFSVDAASLPLVLYSFSAVAYLSFSAAAHLLHSRSEQLHHSLFFLDYVGVAVHQYGCSLALSLYSADATWTQSMLGKVFLPGSALLSWSSCAACCYAKLRSHRLTPLNRKFFLVPTGAASLLNIGLVVRRLEAQRWSSSPAPLLHLLQVALFLPSSFFFCCPVPERFAPGRFDIIGHAHQLLHLLSALRTLLQQEALFHDFLWRRPALLRQFGEERLLLACSSFCCLTLCCAATAASVQRRAQLRREQR
uniref:Membrane progestin receptor beta-like n=1 Tax=Stegastes partitus TaxID=144197 RepID=A0A3B5AK00_9TELE